MAGGYHVHEFPLPYQFTTETDLCGSGVTRGHFNPLGATTGSTQDEFEVGFMYKVTAQTKYSYVKLSY